MSVFSSGDGHGSWASSWREARACGQRVTLMANSTETVARLNRHAQLKRLATGELSPTAPRLELGDDSILVGDEVVTRRNDRTLRTDQGHMVKNRDHWAVAEVHADLSVTVAGRTGTIRLPAEYVAEHVQLGYAQTSHATQGRTVDTALVLIDTPTDSRGIYTPMTRGRDANHAYVVVEENQTARDVLTQAIGRDWIVEPAVERQAQLNQGLSGAPVSKDDQLAQLEERVRESRERQAQRLEHSQSLGLELCTTSQACDSQHM